MGVLVTINSVTGQTPYDVYICQNDGSGCFYIARTSTIPYNFEIPAPYDNANSYMLKIVDADGCVITGVENL